MKRHLLELLCVALWLVAGSVCGEGHHSARDGFSWMAELHRISVECYVPRHHGHLPATMDEVLQYVPYKDTKRRMGAEFLFNEACANKLIYNVDKKAPIFIDKVAYGDQFRLCWLNGSMSFASHAQLLEMRKHLGKNVIEWLISISPPRRQSPAQDR